MPSSRGSSQPKNGTCVSWVSCTGMRTFYHSATLEALKCHGMALKVFPLQGQLSKQLEKPNQAPTVLSSHKSELDLLSDLVPHQGTRIHHCPGLQSTENICSSRMGLQSPESLVLLLALPQAYEPQAAPSAHTPPHLPLFLILLGFFLSLLKGV